MFNDVRPFFRWAFGVVNVLCAAGSFVLLATRSGPPAVRGFILAMGVASLLFALALFRPAASRWAMATYAAILVLVSNWQLARHDDLWRLALLDGSVLALVTLVVVRKRWLRLFIGSETIVTRSIVRGILLSDSGEVLLMKMSFPWFEDPVWIAPGGGLRDGEPPVEGLRRELQEETGRGDLRIGPQVWERRFVVEHEGRVVHAHERYFVVRTESFIPDGRGLEEQEAAWFEGFRWWGLDELASSPEPTSPDTLPSLLRRIAAELVR